ncbi:hypothetical protein KDU71_07580 [Carboxylicivirga sediminis]|uniref:Uncharacterized protein n=1 Tax=Carboxylicivirga sediminis TaxID=2006564 RepID=A0A941F2Y0_9BACT|nr:hypothetical protein [Carboxylicivirga sediminis]MBR8535417.1 hypothetical protein [Carboxylicivirga sediminis]
MVLMFSIVATIDFFHNVYLFTVYGGNVDLKTSKQKEKCPWSDKAIRDFVDRMEHLPAPEEDEFTPLSEKLSSRYPFPIWDVRPLVKRLRENNDEKDTEKIAAKVLAHADKYTVTIEDSYKALEILDELRA